MASTSDFLMTTLSNVSHKGTSALTGTGAEWEVFYNNTWRDIESNYSWDITQEGNTILRAQRYDSGEYRSYREDRGLILRRKNDKKEEKGKSISGSTAFTLANLALAALTVTPYGRAAKTALIGMDIFAAAETVSRGESLADAAINLGISITLGKVAGAVGRKLGSSIFKAGTEAVSVPALTQPKPTKWPFTIVEPAKPSMDLVMVDGVLQEVDKRSFIQTMAEHPFDVNKYVANHKENLAAAQSAANTVLAGIKNNILKLKPTRSKSGADLQKSLAELARKLREGNNL